MQLYVGTSGYAYKEWKGTFYPADLPEKQMLTFYGEQFRAVEINNTFYRMPKASVLEEWCNHVPEDFRFILKAPQRITHFQRLKDCAENVAYLLNVAGSLGNRLGPLLFQLPPNLKKDAPRLRAFLEVIPADQRIAFEFRNQSWFDDEVLDLLREHRAALCIAEADDELQIPFAVTADWGYLRLRMVEYTEEQLAGWERKVRESGWQDAFVFFKHEDAGTGPKLARRFLSLAGEPPLPEAGT